MRFHIDQPAGAGDGSNDRRVFSKSDAQKASQTEGVLQTPGNTALGFDALKISDHQ